MIHFDGFVDTDDIPFFLEQIEAESREWGINGLSSL